MTTTSNIHLGIAGWSNATYVVGARRSNAGNAYQCVTAGTSTSPPTGTGSSINNGGTSVWKYLSAVDFTTWQAHANAIVATTTQPVVGLLWNDSTVTATLGTRIVWLQGHTTSPTNNITYKPAPGESFQAVYLASPTTAYAYNAANGVAFQCPASGVGGINYIQIDDSNVIIEGIQFKDPNSTSGSSMVGGSGANVTVRKCIFDGFAQSGGATPLGISGAGLTLSNCLFVTRNTTAGGAVVSTSGASGAAVANNTFVHTSLVTGQYALDSGSNGTTSSMTSTNNIFYNYANVYASSVGGSTPWLSTHCAYSMVSFGAGNSGTDAGGSIYGITAAATFAGFSTNMNPKAAASILNAGSTDTTDIPAADDAFGNSRPQGSSWDIGAVELLAVSASVQRDFAAFFDIKESIGPPGNSWSSDFSPDFGDGAFTGSGPSFGIEWRQAFVRDIGPRIEWSNNTIGPHPITQIGDISIEILHSLPAVPNPFDQIFSNEFGLGGSYTIDPTFALEWPASAPGAARDAAMGIEWRATTVRDDVAAEEVLQSAPTLLSPWSPAWSQAFGFGPFTIFPAPFPLEWASSAGGATVSAAIGLEFQVAVQRAAAAGIEPNITGRRDAVAPMDFAVSATFVANMAAGIEWRQSFRADAAVPLAFGTPSTSADMTASAEWRGGMVADVASLTDRRGTLLADSIGPVAWAQPVVGAATAVIEVGAVAARDSSAPIVTLATIREDVIALITSDILLSPVSATAPLEFTSGVTGIRDTTVGVEWTAPVTLSMTLPAASEASLARDGRATVETSAGMQRDASVPLAAGTGTLRDAAAPIEFGHLTISFTATSSFPLEIKSVVVADARPAIEDRKKRKTIGNKLEPDQFEAEHEP